MTYGNPSLSYLKYGLGTLGYLGNLVWVLVGVYTVFRVLSRYRVFQKAGHNGLLSLVPIYSEYVLGKIAYNDKGIALLHMALTTVLMSSGGAGVVLSLLYTGLVFGRALCESFGMEIGSKDSLFLPVSIALPVLNVIAMWKLADGNYTGAKESLIHKILHIQMNGEAETSEQL